MLLFLAKKNFMIYKLDELEKKQSVGTRVSQEWGIEHKVQGCKDTRVMQLQLLHDQEVILFTGFTDRIQRMK